MIGKESSKHPILSETDKRRLILLIELSECAYSCLREENFTKAYQNLTKGKDYGESIIKIEPEDDGSNIPALQLMAKLYFFLGNVCNKLGKKEECIENREKAIVAFEKIGNYFNGIDNFEDALTNYRWEYVACVLNHSANHQKTAQCHTYIGDMLSKLGKESEAKAAYAIAESIRKKL
jgi:tetratricopeptide (TPR) repeat protein